MNKAISEKLANLMAYIILADGKVSDEEIEFFSGYIKTYYPDDISDRMFESFLSALKKQPRLEVVLEDINQELAGQYSEKVSLAIKSYELMASDGLSQSELELFTEICDILGLKNEDSDLIRSLFVDRYEYEYAINQVRKISVNSDMNSADMVTVDLAVDFIEIGSGLFAVNHQDSPAAYADQSIFHKKQIKLLTDITTISTRKTEIKTADVPLLFALKKQQTRAEYHLSYEEGRVLAKSGGGNSDFTVSVEGPLIRLYKNSASNISLSTQKAEVADFTFLSISDSIIINGGFKLPVVKIIHKGVTAPFELEEIDTGKDEIIISDEDQLADIYIDDENDDPLKITVRINRQGANGTEFTVVPQKLSIPVHISGKRLKRGQEVRITSETTLVAGKTQVLFEPGPGRISSSLVLFQHFKVDKLVYAFKNGKTGIDGISFEARSGDLTAIMGASGAGKSTLLQLLLGYLKPKNGSVYVNGKDFYQNFDHLRHYIGYVPQDDLLMQNLTVYQNLAYSAQIRMPQKSKQDIRASADRVLKDIGLYDKRDLRVGSAVDKVLSGGQRKRLNIGLELMANPDLFFLDEPTSGLSSKDSDVIVDLLRNLSNRGKIVFVIIHQPGSELYKKFDQLLLLDTGGKLAYYGRALDAIHYFKRFTPARDSFTECPSCGNVNPEIIFNVLEKKELAKDGSIIYRESRSWGRGPAAVFRRLFNRPVVNSIPVRRHDPDYWKHLYLSKKTTLEDAEGLPAAGKAASLELPPARKTTALKKSKVLGSLIKRVFMDKIRDTSNLIMTFLVPAILGVILAFLLRGDTAPYLYFMNGQMTKYLFLSVIIFIFFGLMASVNTVIKDRPMLTREKIVDIKPWQYMVSKAFVFSVFSAFQIVIYSSIGFMVLDIPFMTPQGLLSVHTMNYYIYFLLTGFITCYVTFSLGMLISSFLRSELAAFNIIPLIIIPQIIFGGLFVEFESMGTVFNKEVPLYSNITLARWSYEALLSGSEYFNPVYQVTSAGNILSLKEEYEREGRKWDYNTYIHKPLQELKSQPAGSVPEFLDESVYENRIELGLSGNKSEMLEVIKKHYRFSQARQGYVLAKPIAASERKKIREAYEAVGPDGFYNRYNLYDTNEAVRKDFYDANSYSWMALLAKERRFSLIDIMGDKNVFPAHMKVWGPLNVPTVWFNLLILVIQAGMFHVITLFRLKKI